MFGLGPYVTVAVIIVILVISGVKILKEYERGVIFRLGRMVDPRGPGIIYVIPLIEKMVRMDLRTVTMDIPPQDVITRDNVSVKVNGVLYFRILDLSEGILASSPGHPDALLSKAVALYGIGRYDEAERIASSLPESPLRRQLIERLEKRAAP